MSMTTHKSPAGTVEQAKSDVCALEYVDSPPPTLTAEQEKKLWRKVDMRILPILTLMYLCSFMDRGAPSVRSLL